MNTPFVEQALAYAAIGLHVFPVHEPLATGEHAKCSCSRAKCDHVAKHPRCTHGFKEATIDPERIRKVWDEFPTTNVAIATGDISGVIVLDVDPRNGGDKTLALLLKEHGPLPPTVHANTGGGGEHYFFKHPGLKVKSGELAEGLDCKADGGYIIVSPSRHASGGVYQWSPGNSPLEREPAPAPLWLLKLMAAEDQRIRSTAKLNGNGPPKKAGRNNTLTSIAGRLRRAGSDEDAIFSELKIKNQEMFDPPLPDAEVQGIAKSVAKYPSGEGPKYEITPGGIIYHKPTKDGTTEVMLTNFTAQIVSDTEEDDGVEKTRSLEIVASLGTRIRKFSVPADAFHLMKWPLKELGASAIVYPGYSGESHARTAIQIHSRDATQKTVFCHTGWRKLDGAWYYMHAGGAVGKDGLASEYSTHLGALERFRLEAPVSGPALHQPLTAVFNLVQLGSPRILYSLIAGVFRAPLGGTDFSLWLFGHTGSFKSETAALCQRFYGRELDARHLPASWASTANAIEETCFRTKDAIVVIDDFKPSGDSGHDNRLHQMADRILRGQGNGSGRARLNANLQPRAPRPSRGLILGTGEDVPRGQSLRGRLLILEISPGEILPSDLTICQGHAEQGFYAAVMASYCQWMAGKYECLQEQFKQRVLELRQEFTGTHTRQPVMLANLQAAFEVFIQFVLETTGESVITAEQADQHVEACLTSLQQAGGAQAHFQAAQDPTTRYVELLRSALTSGRAHVADVAGGEPENARAWGWRPEAYGSVTQMRPGGDRIGWVEGEDLYLDPDAAYRVANQVAPSGEQLQVSETTLRRRMEKHRLLKSTDKDRSTLTVRRTISGHRTAVLHLRASTLAVPADDSEEDNT